MSNIYNQPPMPATPQYGPPQPTQSGSNGLATAGFVLALLGLLGSWIPFLNVLGIILAVLGLILSGIGLARSGRVSAGKGLAIAGLVMGVLAIIVAVIINVAFVGAVEQAVDDTTSTKVKAPKGAAAAGEAAEAADSEIGTTRDNPAPLGSEISGGDWTVTINSVKTVDADSIGQKPATGSTLLLVNLKATYTGDDSQGSTPFTTVDFVTADGNTVDGLSGSTMFLADKEFNSLKTVFAGASVEGDQILEVPASSWKKGVLAVTPDMLSDATFVSVQ